ncbi:MAG: 2-oxoacid:ferredoxin oxidoreductase subunit gamma [Bacillales bacterium]|jgi:2-oxoglutarate ferredoxin oxidoreductase subunit gamma|nr:2-oxoacid:ferredoxin oxidoreductase subunit gamma [Bacillales bacterium]
MALLEEIVFAGFGGQGVMSMGQTVAYAGMVEGKQVSWLPSYGPEQRGGTANAMVVVSDTPVGSPLITKPTVAVILNNPSLEKFESSIKPGGILLTNSTLVTDKSTRDDIRILEIDATNIAIELGNERIANMVLLGALLQITGIVSIEGIMDALKKVLGDSKKHLLDVNRKALEKGFEIAENSAEMK